MAWYHIKHNVQFDAKSYGLSHVFTEKIEKNYSYNAGCNAGGKVFIFSILCVVLTLYIDQAANILLIS